MMDDQVEPDTIGGAFKGARPGIGPQFDKDPASDNTMDRNVTVIVKSVS